MAKGPPDFTKFFFDALGGAPAPVRYPLRRGPSLLHDVAFLSSLVNDARVLNPGAAAAGEVLTIRLNRDCWGLGLVDKGGSRELYVADATLTCRGVRSVAWHLSERAQEEPWLTHLWIEDAYHAETLKLLLVGRNWHCGVLLDEDAWSVELEDQQTPYLWSARNAG